ncbi:type II secretion system protein GspJ [Stakelama tenebrarum]|uniref:Type II secretion system protein J n=1 Tax=Stakelama tenebrarum TaxID=2711215 RepID=A0A6G6Y4V1_9SPHN|nr:type II secretion system protein GspJ [Sphingosinithalassobacter tenebrarum]QIG79748.1 prepilin-type N-terminal cleavage/methylation domain-containing protein [Sphingosinithalassobacter tenebrarum]
MNARPRESGREAGFTLIEVMVSLGLFALIAVAGLAMVDGILGVGERTEVRLDRLGQLQRTTYVITDDLDQIARGPISGDAAGIGFTRAAPGFGGAPVAMRYQLNGGTLVRNIGGMPQLLLPGVTAMRWQYWDGEWQDRWPIDEARPDAWPRAVAVDLELAGQGPGSGTLRRVIALPARPDAKPEPAE